MLTPMRRTLAVTALALAPVLGLAACNMNKTSPTTEEAVMLNISPKEHTVNQGEIVTIQVESVNALNKDIQTEWTSTGGTFTQEDPELAQIKFDEPGVYTVTANFTVNGKPQPAQLVRITVKEI